MFIRIVFFLIGFGFSIIGFDFIISYLNLITIGYNLNAYVHFIISSPECMIGPIGLIITFLSIYLPGGKKHELYI